MEWDRARYDGTGYKISEQITEQEGELVLELLFKFGGQVCTYIHKCSCVISYKAKGSFITKSLNTTVIEMRLST